MKSHFTTFLFEYKKEATGFYAEIKILTLSYLF